MVARATWRRSTPARSSLLEFLASALGMVPRREPFELSERLHGVRAGAARAAARR